MPNEVAEGNTDMRESPQPKAYERVRAAVRKTCDLERSKVASRLKKAKSDTASSSAAAEADKLAHHLERLKQLDRDVLTRAACRLLGVPASSQEEDCTREWKELYSDATDDVKGLVGKLLQKKEIAHALEQPPQKQGKKRGHATKTLTRGQGRKHGAGASRPSIKNVAKRSSGRDNGQNDPRPGAERFSEPTSMFLSSLNPDDMPSARSMLGVRDTAIRKNRMGQRARRALLEKIHGRNANHLKNGGAGDTGALSSDGARQVSTSKRAASRASVTPAADPSVHPSWQASRSQKEKERAASFKGVRVTFGD
ncbi:Protein bud22 [Porphyridium purpureum]|uniref:Protein bud22 n=1 Tax=Porphyridium purpureum TaxID=35688 RepID=A0A5J4YZ16_PORPP|nr:Protein bud22 [Porphyridium purpureum]|eukprot:POR6960..scf209_3